MKKIFSITMALIMLVSILPSFPVASFAASGSGVVENVENPFYANSSATYANESQAASYTIMKPETLRDKMVNRTESFNCSFTSPTAISRNELTKNVQKLFMTATSDDLSVSNVDGDYIRWQFSGYSFKYAYSKNSSGVYNYSLDFTVEYYDSADEEAKVNEIISDYLSSLNLIEYSDYDLIKEFHDFIINSCDYDYAYNSRNDKYDFSIYGALAKGRSVCQGYTLAFYRLCKEAGLDVRILSSDPDEGCHAWNIVYVGDAYYYVDCTWDDQLDNQYQMFLVGDDTLQSLDKNYEHKLYEKYYYDALYESNFESKYNSKISESSWNSEANNLANCKVKINYANNAVSVVNKNGKALTNGTDYTVSYAYSNYVAVLTGKGEYSNSSVKRKGFINGLKPSLEYTKVQYSNQEKKPKVTITGLKNGTDYTVGYSQNVKAGTAIVSITAKGKYNGTICTEFTITKADIASFNSKLEYESISYDGKSKCPKVVLSPLKEGIDYSIIYYSNTEPGTAYVEIKGTDNCYGTVKKSFKINRSSIKNKNISLSATTYTYNGNAKKPKVSVSGLVEGKNYKVSYSSNVKPGIAKVTITGIGGYTDTVTKTFKIKPSKVGSLKAQSKQNSITLKWKKCKNVSGYVVECYSGNKWKKVKTLSSDKNTVDIKKLSPSTIYKYRVRAYVKTSSGNIYGEYSGVVLTATKPAKVKIKNPSTSKKTITVKWNSTKCTGYQVQYSKNSNFKKATTKNVNGSSKKSYKIKSLTKGKKYYVRVRAYKTVDGKKVYGAWSSKKSIICK